MLDAADCAETSRWQMTTQSFIINPTEQKYDVRDVRCRLTLHRSEPSSTTTASHRLSVMIVRTFFCGFTAESSFGAWSYLIVRDPENGGNVLIDSPRFATQLAKRIEAMGGVRRMFLTHRDDVADHDRFAERFQSERIMHSDDGASRLGIETVIRGDEPFALDADLLAIPVPGHTRGHTVLLYRNRFLFTGDHCRSPHAKYFTAFRVRVVFVGAQNIRGKAPAV